MKKRKKTKTKKKKRKDEEMIHTLVRNSFRRTREIKNRKANTKTTDYTEEENIILIVVVSFDILFDYQGDIITHRGGRGPERGGRFCSMKHWMADPEGKRDCTQFYSKWIDN